METLRDKDFNRKLDRYLMTGKMAASDYETMTRAQKTVVQCIKRSFARINTDL